MKMRWPTTRIWTIKIDGYNFMLGTLPGALLCRLGLHRWVSVESKTMAQLYAGSPVRPLDEDYLDKRVHLWRCRRDFCGAEFDYIFEETSRRYRGEGEHRKVMGDWAKKWKRENKV